MPDSAIICESCGAQLKLGAKFCGGCGSPVKQAVQTAAAQTSHETPQTESFREIVRSILLEGAELSEVLDILMENAAEIGVDKYEAAKIIQETDQEISASNKTNIRLHYELNTARSGVATGNTLLILKAENLSTKLIRALSIHLKHPESGKYVETPLLSTLVKGVAKVTELDFVLDRVGNHSIREGFIKTTAINGTNEYYKINSVIRLSAENSSASKANIFSQSIQTHGGGVVSASSGATLSQKSNSKNEEQWESIALLIISEETYNNSLESTSSPLNSQRIESSVKSFNEALLLDTDDLNKSDVLTESKKPADLTDFRKILPSDIESKASTSNLLKELLSSISNLLQLLSAAQTVTKYAVWRHDDIDYLLVHKLSILCQVNAEQIFAIAVYEGNRNHKTLESFSGKATVVAIDGFYEVLSSQLGDLECIEYHSWENIRESTAWDFKNKSFGEEGNKVFLGESSANSILGFDLRGVKSSSDINKIFESLRNRYKNLLSITEIYDSFDEEVEEIVSQDIEDDENYDDEQIDDNEIENLIYQFFTTYSFVSQYCHEEIDRSVHVYNSETSTGDISPDLVESLTNLLNGSTPIAVCEDDRDSTHDNSGALVSWYGLASVITKKGIHHVNCFDGVLSLDGKNNILTWYRFFKEIQAGLIVRNEMPDIWIGTRDHVLIKGSYVDYSGDISAWIYYVNFVRQDLTSKFAQFRMAITG